MSVAAARNVVIVLALGALVAFGPGGGDAAQIIAAVLSTLILASFVWLAARFYREHRYDLDGLGDAWRGLLYGAIALVIFAMAARQRLLDTSAGAIVWVACLAGAAYAGYRVWRHWREYA